ncbi:MAG: Ferrous-iron efflux pump FieF [Herbaspirillum frisingense]|uniref:Ferrous-iron efflux pump FieF n=1 Tax=Herbaspirillum frisingense TaxID=92645 RepID=A0A7V8FUA3_9BURK|nr:MAG: Ferrous-iron efflux pump FieF [Herbaspirillum frisingense]
MARTLTRAVAQLRRELDGEAAGGGPSRPVIYAALAGNLMVALTKLAAALWTGSSAMLSECIHSAVDMGNELLLLYGMRRADIRPDPEHPFGYGRELYFWSFVVAVLIFTLGAGMSIYEGVNHILDPEPIRNVHVNYLVLLASALFEGATWLFTLSRFKGRRGIAELAGAVRESKDPPTFIVLLEDTAAILGIVIAFAGIWLSQVYADPRLDGVASIAIGCLLACTAWVLARETKDLLIGERAHQGIVDAILQTASGVEGVVGAHGAMTAHLAPNQILAALSVEFDDELKTGDIEALVVEMERRIRAAHPEVMVLFIKPQSRHGFHQALADRYGDTVADYTVEKHGGH